MRRTIGVIIGILFAITGCGRKSSLLLERQALGPIAEEPAIAMPILRHLEPAIQTQTKERIDVSVTFATAEYLKALFSNKAIFGAMAGHNPFYPEHLIFYVKIANQSDQKIRINPAEFVLLDDRGTQYRTIGVDYVTAFAEFRQPVGTTTRGVVEGANPGYFGISLPVGRFIAAKPQDRFALLQRSALQVGYLYPGVTHDGLIAFWNPSREAKKFRLLITNVKTGFDANDQPKATLEFPFEFNEAPQ